MTEPLSPPPSTRLAALVVNYNTGGFALRCIESLMRVWTGAGRSLDRLEMVVVDNASPEDQEPWLEVIEERGARVVRNDENLGYAGAINQAYALTSGGPDDIVAILNADVIFLPGSVETMMDYLVRNPRVGVVDPHMSIDMGGHLNMPRNMLPTVGNQLRTALARISRRSCRAYSDRRIRLTLPWWTTSGPLDSDMLSGACLLMRREVVDELGAPLNDDYPLYYEDTDLFMTLRRKGYRVVHHGGARILHHWSRSAKPGGAFGGELLAKNETSKRIYFKKFHGLLGWWTVACIDRLLKLLPFRAGPMHDIVDLGSFPEPIEIPLPRDCRFLLELSDEPAWLLTVGIVGRGRSWTCPAESWQWVFDMTYYVRALDLDTLEVLGAWRFTKESPGRQMPLDGPEMNEIFAPGSPMETVRD